MPFFQEKALMRDNFIFNKIRPIGQIAGYDMPISPINTGDVAISNLWNAKFTFENAQ